MAKQPVPQFVKVHMRTMADDLVLHATALLGMAARLRGDIPGMPMQAEFQALDIMSNDFAGRLVKHRAVIGNVE